MGYSGYERRLCANGHLNLYDAYEWDDDEKCPDCGADFVVVNYCDTTNGINSRTEEGYGYVDFEIIKEAEYKTCKECGHKTLISKEIYKIPTKEEYEKMQQKELEQDEED